MRGHGWRELLVVVLAPPLATAKAAWAAGLPPDLGEHSASIIIGLMFVMSLAFGALIKLWSDNERRKENAVACALKDLGKQVEQFGIKFDGIIEKIFSEIEDVKTIQNRQSIICASLHGVQPWEGVDRRKEPPVAGHP